MRDLKDQLRDYLDNVVERLEAPDTNEPRLRSLLGRYGQPRINRRRPPAWAYGLAAAAATLLLVGVGAWVIRNADGQTPSTLLKQPATLVYPTLDDFEFIPADSEGRLGIQPFLRPPGILNNGTSFLTESKDGTDWVSPDGVTWSPSQEGVRPIYGGKGEFLAITTDAFTELSPSSRTRLWRSSDGLRWREASARDEALWRLATFRYFGLGVDEILSLSLSLPDAWAEGAPAGAILKLDDKYVAYYFSEGYGQRLPRNGDSSYLRAAVSTDGRTWRAAEAPDFLHDWFQDEVRAMPDRGLSDQTWSWTFAVNGDRALALTGDAHGHTLWESSDGLQWEPISIAYLDQPSFDVFGAAANSHGTPLPTAFAYRVAALEQGWAILPLGTFFEPSQNEETPSVTGRGVLFSVDGHNWLPLQFDFGAAAAAGNKIFIRGSDLVVATFKGSSGQPDPATP